MASSAEQAAYILVRDALIALSRGRIEEHLVAVADDVVLDQVTDGRLMPPITGKVMYRAYLLQGPLEADMAAFNVYGPIAAIIPPPGIGRRATADLIWVRAELRPRDTGSSSSEHPPSVGGTPHLWFGVAGGRIRAVEVAEVPPQRWHGQVRT